MFNWKKSAPDEPVEETVEKQSVTEYENSLTIYWKDGTSMWWAYKGPEKRSNETVWRPFLTWYHGRKSPCYTIHYANEDRNGSLTFRRADIKRFSMDCIVINKTVDSDDE